MANEERSSTREERINDLPDAILGNILSSFPTKDAVRTSVLSKRWRYVWTSVPFIEIVDNHRRVTTLEYRECFSNFVDRVLSLNNVYCLPKMVLLCYEDCGRFPEWISAITIRDIEELHLEYMGDKYIELPHCLFMCKNLVTLKLYNHFVLNVPTMACRLLHLKVLHLYKVQFFDEDSMKNLLAGCPVLEELNMKWKSLKWIKTLHIQSASLKSLRVNIQFSGFDNIISFIDATNLERLDFTVKSCKTKRFDVHSNLSSLVSVYLHLYHLSSDYFIELLNKISNTKYLRLTFSTIHPLNLANSKDLHMFHYLTHLVLDTVEYSLSVLPYLLGCSPNLITFDLYVEIRHGLDEVEFSTPNCLMLHLENVNMKGLGRSQCEIDMAKYFLKNAPVLKKMSISFFFSCEDRKISKELFMTPKSSSECELQISYGLLFCHEICYPLSGDQD